jgi:hypothetical protein
MPVNFRLPTFGPAEAARVPGRTLFLPEDEYFLDTPSFPVIDSLGVTLECLALWANEYEAGVIPSPVTRSGELVGDGPTRQHQIGEIFRWILETAKTEAIDGDPSQWFFILIQDGVWLLDGHEGLPGVLSLTNDQWEELRSWWVAHGLPGDLYYPEDTGRLVVEPVQTKLGVLRGKQWYSPRRWQTKDKGIENIVVPSEEERQSAFHQACTNFLLAVVLRKEQLQEPGNERDTPLLRQLTETERLIWDLWRQSDAPAHSRIPPD